MFVSITNKEQMKKLYDFLFVQQLDFEACFPDDGTKECDNEDVYKRQLLLRHLACKVAAPETAEAFFIEDITPFMNMLRRWRRSNCLEKCPHHPAGSR